MAVLVCHLCEQLVGTPVVLADKTFCCHGCRDMWQLLGEEHVSELKHRPGLNWRMVQSAHADSSQEDSRTDQLTTVNFQLSRLWCASCGKLVQHVVDRLPGVSVSEVTYPASSLRVLFDPHMTTPTKIGDVVAGLGYGVESSEPSEDDAKSERGLLRRFAIALALSLLLMMGSVPIWSGYLPEFPHRLRLLLSGILWGLSTPVVFWAGLPFLHGAWKSLRHRIPTMDLLVSSAGLAAYFYSVIAMINNASYLYFDTCGFLITFLLAGRVLESTTRQRAVTVVRSLAKLSVKEANVLRNHQEETIPVADLQTDDLVVVRPGGRIPIDGVIVEGTSDVDESFLTGESFCDAKTVGDRVYAGTTTYAGKLVIRTTRPADRSVLSQTLQFVLDTQASGYFYQRMVDRVIQIFVPTILAIGVLTFCYWEWATPIGTPQAIMRAIATFVIACPCALSVATPVASQCAIHVLGKNGVLLRSDEAIERSVGITSVVLDKTATLTEGSVRLADYYPKDPVFLQWAASVEAGSEHPLGRAVVEAANRQGLSLKPAKAFVAHPGHGVTATVEGHQISILRDDGESLPVHLATYLAHPDMSEHSISIVRVDGVPSAVLCFADTLRPDALETVENLTRMGISVHMATGDRQHVAKQIAKSTAISSWSAGLTPIQKSNYVKELQRFGEKVAYVGDGINDAPALLQSDIGIAMGSGTDIAMQAGHLVLTQSQLNAIPFIFSTSRQAVLVIRQNLAWAIAYNSAALTAAFVGFTRPSVAAAAMAASSAFVLFNSLRLLGTQHFVYVKRFSAVAVGVLMLLGLAWYRV